jgi:hypothetical protein
MAAWGQMQKSEVEQGSGTQGALTQLLGPPFEAGQQLEKYPFFFL